jgi:hypothetical protein
MDENEHVKLMDKKADELTVGDQLKVAAIGTGLILGIYAGAFAAIAAIGYYSDRRRQKQETKLQLVQDNPEE